MEAAGLFLFLAIFGVVRGSSCRGAGLCCVGRDGSCRGGPSCYCDHECLQLADCCPDFQEFCGVRDCEVSAWGPWSECSTSCGTGSMTRERRVTSSPSNGGQVCPQLVQQRSCFGVQCNGKSHAMLSREAAMILPATYSTIRQVNDTEDIRSNLRLRYRKNPDDALSKEYCIMFEISKVSKACKSLDAPIAQRFVSGKRVCVACEKAAMRQHLGYQCQGQGSEQMQTRFTFLAFSQCHGRWLHLKTDQNCECTDSKKPDFLFV